MYVSPRYVHFRPYFLLFFSRLHTDFARLSVNITREICSYLSIPKVFVYLSSHQIHYFYFATQETMSLRCAIAYTEEQSYCMLDQVSLLLVGGIRQSQEVMRVNYLRMEVSREENMLEGRTFPGIIYYRGRVWTFGGRQKRSSEHYSVLTRHWTQSKPMEYCRMCFTPCLWQEEIYLVSVSSWPCAVEVFSPSNNEYRNLAITLQDVSFFGCISYIIQGELIILTYSGTRERWKLGESLTRLNADEVIPRVETAVSPCPVQMHGNSLYWPLTEGRLSILELRVPTSPDPEANKAVKRRKSLE